MYVQHQIHGRLSVRKHRGGIMVTCSFCGTDEAEAAVIICRQNDDSAICDQCVSDCNEIIVNHYGIDESITLN